MSAISTSRPDRGGPGSSAPTAPLFDGAGRRLGTVELDRALFSVAVNAPLLHQVVTAQLAAKRAGTQSTRTRAEVRGGGAKPYRQKGTGRARQGSTRAPHFSGGGVAFAPKPRSYVQRTPRKMVQQALRVALSDRCNGGQILVCDDFGFEEPKTSKARALLEAVGARQRTLVVLGPDDVVAARSFSNLSSIELGLAGQLSAYDVLRADTVLFSLASLPGEAGRIVRNASAPEPADAGEDSSASGEGEGEPTDE
jgi:large subunit ribosomal protein L4